MTPQFTSNQPVFVVPAEHAGHVVGCYRADGGFTYDVRRYGGQTHRWAEDELVAHTETSGERAQRRAGFVSSLRGSA